MGTIMGVRQASKLDMALERHGYTTLDVDKMCEGDVLAKLLPIVRGNGEVTLVRHIIDCDVDPFVPNGWKGVEEHKKHGQLEWDGGKGIDLYLSSNQREGTSIEGDKLRKELASKAVLNANVLDYLLAHPDLIPEEWKVDSEGRTRYIFFWGTIYRDAVDNLYVRSLFFNFGRWRWYYNWLDLDWYVNDPAARLAS